MYEKIILVTRRSRLEELVQKYGSERQARFHIEHANGNFETYVSEHKAYTAALEALRPVLSSFASLQFQKIDRTLVKSFMFRHTDVIVTLGQDGLVANTAKYVGAQPIVSLNPSPKIYDGILMPFVVEQAKAAIASLLKGTATLRSVTLGEAVFSDGQTLLAFNDFYIGSRTHTSSRYELDFDYHCENQSSSGVIVSTGAGSTGWMSSVMNMANSISEICGGKRGQVPKLAWEDSKLAFAVREPFLSQTSKAGMVFGIVDAAHSLRIASQMPSNGVVFSDGIEDDYINFNSGVSVKIGPADHQANLVVRI